jgi:hypothetical protein
MASIGLQELGRWFEREGRMFRAGQRSARRRLRLWQSLAGTMMFLAAGLGWPSRTFHEPPQERGLQSAETPGGQRASLRAEARAPLQTAALMDPSHTDPVVVQRRGPVGDYLDLRRRVALEGLDALPSSGGAPASPEPIQSIADWLRLPRGAAFSSDPFASSRAPTKGNPS